MFIGSCRLVLEIPGNNSLKGKRMVVKSLKDRLRNRFQVSVAEVEDLDNHRRAVLGVAYVTNTRRHANQVMDQVVDFVDADGNIYLVDYVIEIL
ncbi:MAG: DUF503 domain-containing protein [Aquificota bacterium]|uniref:DUF503 domain-containing protein n=1 Tax=Thermosulfidibacter takaii TaxID=412593 RepID=A0A7C0Y629_9BACT|nr:MAG: DUF503 domain-containing protein [Aquificota bacterium]RLE00154.1 MAG: DUF503 domain-containing protein [Aquificota bacterium]HDD53275.1 DUF503 domain-containing protein [Thermosulfidibacter takaii]